MLLNILSLVFPCTHQIWHPLCSWINNIFLVPGMTYFLNDINAILGTGCRLPLISSPRLGGRIVDWSHGVQINIWLGFNTLKETCWKGWAAIKLLSGKVRCYKFPALRHGLGRDEHVAVIPSRINFTCDGIYPCMKGKCFPFLHGNLWSLLSDFVALYVNKLYADWLQTIILVQERSRRL